jgi:hypothetical protein
MLIELARSDESARTSPVVSRLLLIREAIDNDKESRDYAKKVVTIERVVFLLSAVAKGNFRG